MKTHRIIETGGSMVHIAKCRASLPKLGCLEPHGPDPPDIHHHHHPHHHQTWKYCKVFLGTVFTENFLQKVGIYWVKNV